MREAVYTFPLVGPLPALLGAQLVLIMFLRNFNQYASILTKNEDRCFLVKYFFFRNQFDKLKSHDLQSIKLRLRTGD